MGDNSPFIHEFPLKIVNMMMFSIAMLNFRSFCPGRRVYKHAKCSIVSFQPPFSQGQQVAPSPCKRHLLIPVRGLTTISPPESNRFRVWISFDRSLTLDGIQNGLLRHENSIGLAVFTAVVSDSKLPPFGRSC